MKEEKVIQDGWEGYRKAVLPDVDHPQILHALRQAFFFGALIAWEQVVTLPTLAPEAASARYQAITAEVLQFGDDACAAVTDALAKKGELHLRLSLDEIRDYIVTFLRA